MEGRKPPVVTSKKIGKGYKFDATTRDLLSTMNSHLRGLNQVEYRNETQLVNDKTLEKQISRSGHSFLRATPFQSRFVSRRNAARKKEKSSVSASNRHRKQDKTIDPQPSDEANDQSADPPKVDKKIQKVKTPNRRLEAIAAAKRSLSAIRAEKSATESLGSSAVMEDTSSQGVEALEVTLTDFESRAQPETQQENLKGESGFPWTTVKLRSVAEDSSEESSSDKRPTWASLTLRKVKPSGEPIRETATADTSTIDENDGDHVETSVGEATLSEKPAHTALQANQNQLIEIIDVEASHHALNDAAISFNQQKGPYKITTSPARVQATSTTRTKEQVVFKLRKNKTSGQEQNLVIRHKIIMLVTPPHADHPADVIWQTPLENTEPLAFDAPNQLVKLVSKDIGEEKELQFLNTSDCMHFMNFYYQNHGSSGEEDVMESIAENAEDDFATLRMECINDEERSLLEKFRSLPKNEKEALHEKITHEESGSKPISLVESKFHSRLDLGGVLSAQLSGKHFPEYISTAEMPTSPVSSFSASIVLSDADLGKAKVYQKLLKVGVPSEGVLDKMQKDNVDQRVINFVLNEQNESELSAEEQKTATKYKKMLSVGLPMEAVRHKMIQDQVPSKIIDYVENGIAAVRKDEPNTTLTREEEELATKYRKMLKIGLETDAVRHRMMKDQVAEKIVAVVIGQEHVQKSNDKPMEDKPATQSLQKNNGLSKEEEALAQQYKRLLKLQIPRGQLESRMRHEGVNENVINHVLGVQAGNSRKTNNASTNAQGSNLVSLHWTPLSGDQLDNSVWKAAKALNTEAADPSKLVELFQKKPKKSAKVKATGHDDVSLGTKARLIDLNRSNNVAISLKSFKDFTFKELSDIIMFLDPCRKLQGERIPFLRDLLPTQTEIKAVSDYTGTDDRLVPAELWFRQIAKIKRIDVKVKVMRTMEMLQVEAREVGENLRLFTRVCNQVMDSEKLQDILAMVLLIGNMLNEGTRSGRAAGFKFDSLLKLTQTKSTDGTTTVLDYLVTLYASKGERNTLNIIADFPECQTASRMLLSDLTMEVKSIQESLDQCKTELDSLKKDATRRKAQVVQPGGQGQDPKLALLTEITKRQTGNDQAVDVNGSEQSSKFQDMRQGIRETSVAPSVFSEISRFERSDKNSIYGAIDRLEEFTKVANVAVSDLENLKKKAITASQELSKFGGEGRNTSATSMLLDILFQFASNLESALKKYDSKCAAEAKQKKEKPTPIESEHTKASARQQSPSEPVPPEKSLVLMVNNMLKNANEATKENFRKGRFVHNPTSEMEAIYQRESEVAGPKSERSGRDLANVIKEKSEGVGHEDVQDARSKFGSPTLPACESSTTGPSLPLPPCPEKSIYGSKLHDRLNISTPEDNNKEEGKSPDSSSSSVLQAVMKFEGRPCPEMRPKASNSIGSARKNGSQKSQVDTKVLEEQRDKIHEIVTDPNKGKHEASAEATLCKHDEALENEDSDMIGKEEDADLCPPSSHALENSSDMVRSNLCLAAPEKKSENTGNDRKPAEEEKKHVSSCDEEQRESEEVDSLHPGCDKDNEESRTDEEKKEVDLVDTTDIPDSSPSTVLDTDEEKKQADLVDTTDNPDSWPSIILDTPANPELGTESATDELSPKSHGSHSTKNEHPYVEQRKTPDESKDIAGMAKSMAGEVQKPDSPKGQFESTISPDKSIHEQTCLGDDALCKSQSDENLQESDISSSHPKQTAKRNDVVDENFLGTAESGLSEQQHDPSRSEGTTSEILSGSQMAQHVETIHTQLLVNEASSKCAPSKGNKEQTSPEKVFDLSGSTQRLSLARENSPLRERLLSGNSIQQVGVNRRGSTGEVKVIMEKAQTMRSKKQTGRRDTGETTLSAPSVLLHTQPFMARRASRSASTNVDTGTEKKPSEAETSASTFELLARKRRSEKHDMKDASGKNGIGRTEHMNDSTEPQSQVDKRRVSESLIPRPSRTTHFEKRARELRDAKKSLGT